MMKFSYNWLQTYFDTPLPAADILAETITFHSSEIEEIIQMAGDTVLDIKVLPDKSAWLMSHRGMAKELSVMLGLPMKSDPFVSAPALPFSADKLFLVCEILAETRFNSFEKTKIFPKVRLERLTRRLLGVFNKHP